MANGFRCILFKVNHNKIAPDIIDGSRSPTKREVLRVAMSVFDPLGLLSCVMVHIKSTLQDIWRENTGWDEPISEKSNEQWQQWIKLVDVIEENKKEIQLHTFTDASEIAFAAVCYLRIEDENGVRCTLVSAKTKVAPTKPMSIPRLELQAAVLGSRLAETVVKGHNIEISRRYFWSDSQTVLKWLESNARKYHPFVALRIGELQESTEIQEWRYVPSKINRADLATKWKCKTNFKIDEAWFHGPEFLSKNESYWPKAPESFIIKDDPEVRSVYIHSEIQIFAPVTPNPDSFSKWSKLVHTQAYFMRAISKFKRTFKKANTPLLSDEITRAEMMLYKKSQWNAYEDEIRDLYQHPEKSLQKSSNIYKYVPYLDKNGVLRMKGRIDNAVCVNENVKRPIILPRKCRITDLIVTYYHEKYLHQNNETILNEIKQKFVIPGLRSKLKDVKRKCQYCKNNSAQPQLPVMGSLPKGRVAAYARRSILARLKQILSLMSRIRAY